MKKTYPAYKKILSGYQGAGRDVYVENDSYEAFQRIYKEYRSDYHMTSIMRKLISLNADPLQGRGNNPAGDIRTSKSGNITLQYSLHNGAVFITCMQISKTRIEQSFGLFPVEYDKEERAWVSKRDPVFALDEEQQWRSKEGTAHYAAVAGRFGSISDAGPLLAEHVIGAYTKEGYLIKEDAKADFAMFYTQKGKHKSPETAQALASIMQQSSLSGLAVNWLVHDMGTDTFKATAKMLKATPLASVRLREANKKAGVVQNQNVYFSNPATGSEASLKKLCEEAGLNYVGLNTNNRDLRRFSTYKNVGMEMGKTLSYGVLATGGGVGAVDLAARQMGAAGLQKAINGGFDALFSGNYLVIAASLVATGFISVGAFKKSKTIAAGMHCTFGKGNQKWYTGDDELLA